MTTIGYVIPEFPGQTHAFFMRERQELLKLGTHASLYSTRPPVAAAAQHAWAAGAAAETVYLTPFRLAYAGAAFARLVMSGPVAWYRCVRAIVDVEGLTRTDRAKLLAMIPIAAYLVSQLKTEGSRHVHIHSCANSAWLGVFVSLLSDITYSLTLHGPLHDYGPAQPTKWKHAKFVVVITRDLLREAREQIPADCQPPMLLAPMGVDIERFVRTVPYHATARGKEVRLVSCGRINPCKGHEDLITAVALLRQQGVDATLTICGSTDSQRREYFDLLQEMIQNNHLQKYVKLTGSVSEDRVREELQNAHFFCLASHKEPLGVATMEAMAMGLPAIVTNSPGVSEMITSGHDGCLVDARSPQQFVDAIRQLTLDPELAREYASNARRTVATRFHSGVSADVIRSGIDCDPILLAQRSATLCPATQASQSSKAAQAPTVSATTAPF